MIAHEAVADFGIGAEIAALAARGVLDPGRAGGPGGTAATPAPYAPGLEKQWLPDRQSIERAAETLIF